MFPSARLVAARLIVSRLITARLVAGLAAALVAALVAGRRAVALLLSGATLAALLFTLNLALAAFLFALLDAFIALGLFFPLNSFVALSLFLALDAFVALSLFFTLDAFVALGLLFALDALVNGRLGAEVVNFAGFLDVQSLRVVEAGLIEHLLAEIDGRAFEIQQLFASEVLRGVDGLFDLFEGRALRSDGGQIQSGFVHRHGVFVRADGEADQAMARQIALVRTRRNPFQLAIGAIDLDARRLHLTMVLRWISTCVLQLFEVEGLPGERRLDREQQQGS